MLLAISDIANEAFPRGGDAVVSRMSLVEEIKRRIEPAGHNFKTYYEWKVLGKVVEPPAAKTRSGEESKGEGDEDFDDKEVKNWEKKRHVHAPLSASDMLHNYYYVLGLGDLGMAASEKEIRAAYRKMALIHHPDKNRAALTDDGEENKNATHTETDPRWLEVQKAYETLIDTEKRRKYDSSLEFDDSIPSDPVDKEKFLDTFRPVFRRNAIFSVKKPVPDIGDDNTPWDQIEKFYDFWFTFETWRDFSAFEEYNPEEAEDRFEKRWMERENKKKKAASVKKESSRLMKLVELAYENDPRVIRRKKEEEEEKKRQKELKKERKIAAIQERERQIQEEIQRKKDEEEQVKRKEEEEKNKVKARVRNAQKEFLTALEEKVKIREFDKFWGQEYVKTVGVEDLERVNETLRGVSASDGDKALAVVKNFVGEMEAEKERRKEEDKKAALKKESGKAGEWTPEEISLLYKAFQKFPVGTKNRWETISQYMKTKTPEEIVAKSKELSNNNSLRVLEKGGPPQKKTNLWDVPSEERKVENPTKDQQNSAKTPPPASKTTATTPTNDAEPPKSVWSQQQQKALEEALAKYPATIEAKERWTKIAESVPGKTYKECVERFKELRALVKNTKPAA